jgi:hypothetical protein
MDIELQGHLISDPSRFPFQGFEQGFNHHGAEMPALAD